MTWQFNIRWRFDKNKHKMRIILLKNKKKRLSIQKSLSECFPMPFPGMQMSFCPSYELLEIAASHGQCKHGRAYEQDF